IDAGCGTGLVMAKVCSRFAWGMGIDVSPQMIRLARARHVSRAKFLEGDCFDLPALCPKAGAVLSRGVLLSHYGRDSGIALLAAARNARVPGGFAVFDYLNKAARAKFSHSPENKTFFTALEAGALARQAGFWRIRALGAPERRVRILLAEV